MAVWTRERIVEAAKEAAGKSGGPLSRREFSRRFGVSQYQIYHLFPESGWTEVRRLAGIARHAKENRFSDEELLQEFHRVVSKLGAIPGRHLFTSVAKVGPSCLMRRFGNKAGTLQRYREWLQKNQPESPLLQLLPIQSKDDIGTPAFWPQERSGAPVWAKRPGAVLGAPINFRGLRYAPTNEQGVVCLFGMVCSELGLVVEAFQSVYPDCEATRRIDNKHNRWQRVRIEFEYSSSNFLDHGHDPAGCDMIVCWEHDWSGCPLEVVELRSLIGQLEDQQTAGARVALSLRKGILCEPSPRKLPLTTAHNSTPQA
jgi:hypothetical protein